MNLKGVEGSNGETKGFIGKGKNPFDLAFEVVRRDSNPKTASLRHIPFFFPFLEDWALRAATSNGLEKPSQSLSGGADQFQISLPSEILPKTMSVGELAAVYACLALHDDGIPITAEKISTLVKAANVPVEPYWPLLFAKLVEKRSIEDLITNVGSGGGGGAVAVAAPTSGGGGGAAAPPPVEEKKEEPKEESDDDMGFSLFD
ncbi:hypothetical protein VitviT2T_023658 [Vitis vinifera]|uniref:60S acidic ribosomal protein P1 n=1 Tax=Vitis vinifera TaxID=29760 RepID=A0ABY9DDD2_VITVI|nr:hypothetical protein VitviT2T_023658 [Vitis vinifera]